MTRRRFRILSWAVACLVGSACELTDTPDRAFEPEILPLPANPSDYAPLAAYEAMHVPADNPMTPEKVALGRQLYWDKRLSGDGALSCYSCHVCEYGLTDGRARAIGAFGKQLTRSAPTVWNIGYHSEFYWDGRAKTLEAQALAAWKGANMGAAQPEEIVAQLNSIKGYREQFQRIFGEDATPQDVSKALAAYMRTIISGDTPWDRWQAGDQAAVSEAAKKGYEAFKKAKCDNCHSGVLFTDLQYHNTGIGMKTEEPDLGRYKVTQVEEDKGAFKTPTLRDISDSAPYFHDGSSPTLEETVEIMVEGGKPNPYLDKTNLEPADLNAEETANLVEFLRSLDQSCQQFEPKLPVE